MKLKNFIRFILSITIIISFSIFNKVIILSQKLYNKTSKVDIFDFKAGIYLVRVQTDDGNISTVKIVKQ